MIDLVRNASQDFRFEKEPLLPEAQPAMLRRTSHSATLRLVVPVIGQEEEDKNVVIKISEPVAEDVYEPPIAFCEKTHKDCGHACKGVTKESKCLPCLDADCAQKAGLFDGVNQDELCTICYTTELGAEACSKLSCGHIFHTNCIVNLLKHKWSTLRISFSFMSCPSCKQEIQMKGLSEPIKAELGPLLGLKKKVEAQALIHAEEQGILKDARLSNINDIYYQKPQEFANHRCSFYQCYDCKKPYFGGLIDCQGEMNNAERN